MIEKKELFKWCSIPAEELKKRKANKVFFFSTFALFTQGPDIFIKAHKTKLFDKIYSTNLTYVPDPIKNTDWFVDADCAE